MSDAPASRENGDELDDLERAVALALDLRLTLRWIPAPPLHQLVDLILTELGRRLSDDP